MYSLNASSRSGSGLWQDGTILEEWAGRTVINSCAQLAYGDAQVVIEGGCAGAPPPRTIHGNHTWQKVRGTTWDSCLDLSDRGLGFGKYPMTKEWLGRRDTYD